MRREKHVKYLGVKINENLNYHHINDLATKLKKINTLLITIRNCVNEKILRSVYFTIFDSHFKGNTNFQDILN